MSRKAYSYIRFSTPDQAKGDSYRRQADAAKRYCEENGLQWADTSEYLFFDRGRSAYKGRHLGDDGELGRFLSLIQDGTIAPGSVLIVESLDRLSRERVVEALPRFLDILKNGVDIYISMDKKLYTRDVKDVDLLISILQMSRAHSESSIKGERVSKAWKEKQAAARDRKKPLGKACPYWLEFDGEAYKVIADRVMVVRKIFELAIGGYGHRAIAKILNSEGVPVFGSIRRNEKGLWGSSSTSKLLANRALLGEYQPTGLVNGSRESIGEPVKDFYPIVISEDKFYEAQAARTTRKVSKASRPTKNFNVWQGVTRCGICGDAMHLVNKGRPPKGAKYLRCYRASKGACVNKQVPLIASEKVFIEILAKVDSLSLIQDSQAKIKKEISILEVRLENVRSRLAELERQMVSLDYDIPQVAVLSVAKLEREEKDLVKRRDELRQNAQREKIINKADFFSRLDMVSYEARAKANYLLKSLNVTISIERHPDLFSYLVSVDGRVSFMAVQSGGAIDIIPLDENTRRVVFEHGDDLAAREIFAKVNSKLPKVWDILQGNFEFMELARSLNKDGR